MKHPFEVGKIYANRIGSYEVISVDENAGVMVVSYVDSGDDQELEIGLQARIWENMHLDEQEDVRLAAEVASRDQRGYGATFSGLKSSDFKTSTEGTTWRSRAGLAGKVALSTSEGIPYTFVSWPIYRWPVAFLTHRENYEMSKFEKGVSKAKFTLETDNAYLYFGFYVEKKDGPMDLQWDWTRLMRRWEADEHLREVIVHAETDHKCRFIGRVSNGDEHFHYANSLEMSAEPLWDEEDSPNLDVKERIVACESIPDDSWGEFYIIAQMPKQQAIASGIDVVAPIASLFKALMPVYEAAVKP